MQALSGEPQGHAVSPPNSRGHSRMGRTKTPGIQGVPKDYFDPEQLQPRLPMPFRMIDRVLRDLVEDVLDAADKEKDEEDLGEEIAAGWIMPGGTNALCVSHTKDGQFSFVGTSTGSIHVYSLAKHRLQNTILVSGPVRSITCQDTRLLAVTTDTHLAVLSVSPHMPFLKPHAFAAIGEDAAGGSIVLSRDLCYAAITCSDGAVVVYRIPPLPDIFDSEEVHDEAPSPIKSAVAAKAQFLDDSLPNGGVAPETSMPPKTPHTHHHDPVPATRLFQVKTPASTGASQASLPSVFFCYAPKPRHVGEIQALECRHLALLFPGTSVIVKYSLNQQEDPKPEVSIRTPYAITCGAIDNDTGLVCTGMRNGGSIVWDNVFNTSKFALEKHAGGAAASVTCCRFVEYPRSDGSAKVYTGAADGTVHEYELEGGTLLRVLCQLRAPVSSLIVTAIPMMIAVDSKNEMRVVVIESGNCVGTLKIPSPDDAPADDAAAQTRNADGDAEIEAANISKAGLTSSRPVSPCSKLPGGVYGEWVCNIGGADVVDEVMTMVRKSPVSPPRKALEEGQVPPEVPFISEPAVKAEGGGGDEVAGAGGDGDGGAEKQAEEGDEPDQQGQSVVFAFKLITLLTKAFPQMAKAAVHAMIVHNSTSETFWQLAGGGNLSAAPHAVTDRYLRDAKNVSGLTDANPSPRTPGGHHHHHHHHHGHGHGHGKSSHGHRGGGSPKKGLSTPGDNLGSILTSLDALDERGHTSKTSKTVPATAKPVVSRSESGASQRSNAKVATLSASNLAMAGVRTGASVVGGSVKSGRSGATATRTRKGSKSGASTPLMTAAPAKAPETFATRNFFDPVDVVMTELHTRAGERHVRKADLKKRNEELLTSEIEASKQQLANAKSAGRKA